MVLALDYGRAAERAGEARGGVCLDAGGERVEEGGGRCYLAQGGGDEEEEVDEEEGLGGCEMHAGAFFRAWGGGAWVFSDFVGFFAFLLEGTRELKERRNQGE